MDNSKIKSVHNLFEQSDLEVEYSEKLKRVDELKEKIFLGEQIKAMVSTKGWEIVSKGLEIQQQIDFNIMTSPERDILDKPYDFISAKNRYNLIKNILNNIKNFIAIGGKAEKELADIQAGKKGFGRFFQNKE